MRKLRPWGVTYLSKIIYLQIVKMGFNWSLVLTHMPWTTILHCLSIGFQVSVLDMPPHRVAVVLQAIRVPLQSFPPLLPLCTATYEMIIYSFKRYLLSTYYCVRLKLVPKTITCGTFSKQVYTVQFRWFLSSPMIAQLGWVSLAQKDA